VDRLEFERRLERGVRAHRFTIAVVFPLLGAALLVASAESLLPAPFRFNPILLLAGTFVMRLPLIATVLPVVDRRGAVVLLGVTAYVYGIELVGITTGWPYGEFSYGIDLGPMVGGVPLGLPLFFLPLVLNAYLLAMLLVGRQQARRPIRLLAAVGIVIAIDLVLDPGAVGLGFWAYLQGGGYYGVPASNFVGWALSGTVAVLAIEFAVPHRVLRRRLEDCEFALDDLVSFVLLWGAVNAFFAHWIPVAVVCLLAAALLQSAWFRGPALADRLRSMWQTH